jgi:LysM repeat protein
MKKQFHKLPRHWIGLVLMLATLFTTPIGYGLAQGTMVTIDPASSTVDVGATTTVDIHIANVTNLYGADVKLTFDPALLEVVDADSGRDGVQIQLGTFLSPDFVAKNTVDPAAGTIALAITQTAPRDPVSGSGDLATITFRGKANGTSAVSFVSVSLSDPDGGAISAGTQGGSITVNGPSPTPTYTPTPGPTPTHTPTSTPPPEGILGYHTVRPGETLYCIARAYGVDPYAIARQNNILNPSLIYAGTVLAIPNVPYTLPAGRVCPRQFNGGTPTPPTCRWYHTVVWGENLYRISLRYGVSMWTIAEANHITNLNYIRAGQVLCIP